MGVFKIRINGGLFVFVAFGCIDEKGFENFITDELERYRLGG